jgi:hypothetical protein
MMVGIILVHVVHRHGGGTHQPRGQGQHEESAAEPGEHPPIMCGRNLPRQPAVTRP